jgi:uroporphyrinogen III methyltransferase/synthase
MSAKRGLVWLVGAGPGDPGLITLRGKECVSGADVIVYDALCNPKLLQYARPDCEIVYAGKQAGLHALKQDEINALICEKALAGWRVCRLKGGDPFVFGRGGEEALYLRERGVDFEIVPGVTAAVAVPAYAGIPVTHRHISTSVRFITGHEDPTKPESELDFDEIAATRGTLVFLMGVQNLAMIAEKLIRAGKEADTPAAVIADGTLPRQRTVLGTLADIAERCEREGISPPAIAVVGEVARLRERLQWFENKPFFGRKILVTRARAQMSELVDLISSMGGEAIEAPSIRLESLAGSPEMLSAARQLSGYDWAVFTSANGVDAFYESLKMEGLDSRAFGNVRVAAIGPGTADALAKRGIDADVVPGQFVAEALLDALEKNGPVAGRRYLVPRADIARPELVDGLRARGAHVNEVEAYRTISETGLPESVVESMEKNEIDLVTFTSSSTVRNFINALPVEQRIELIRNIRAASIGPVTTQTLLEFEVPVVVQAEASTIPGLAAAMEAYFLEQKV